MVIRPKAHSDFIIRELLRFRTHWSFPVTSQLLLVPNGEQESWEGSTALSLYINRVLHNLALRLSFNFSIAHLKRQHHTLVQGYSASNI